MFTSIAESTNYRFMHFDKFMNYLIDAYFFMIMLKNLHLEC